MGLSVIESTDEKLLWKKQLSSLVSDPVELCKLLELNGQDTSTLKQVCEQFPLRVPMPYLERMEKGNLRDPLLMQVLPQGQELIETPGYTADPLEEAKFVPVKGLLHKYHGRVLVVMNGSCAIHCRYCFRRHFPYQEHQIGQVQWQSILEYIASDESIEEVIFSGGDPLTCTDSMLAKRCEDLQNIRHISRLRLHTRLPVMIPSRVNETCLSWMTASRLQVVMVIHANHAQEIDAETGSALQRLVKAGVTVLNQAVLLKGINDNADVLAQLCKILFVYGVLPYYLHLFDPVQGAAHFNVEEQRALEIREELQAALPGYLVPKLVVELAHRLNKTAL